MGLFGGNSGKINLPKVYKLLCKEWSKINFKQELEKDRLKITASLTINGIDDDVFMSVRVRESGGVFCEMVFDQLDPSFEAYDLINEFNESCPLKGSISSRNNKKYFVICDNSSSNTSEEAAEAISSFLYSIVDDDTEKLYKPIAALTY